LVVVPAGLGRRLEQGNPAEKLDVVLSTSRLDAVVEQAAADLTLTVQAGATLSAVNETLRPSGQWLPFDPPHAAETTIGGLIAANASGPSRQAFGTVREWLLGVRCVLAGGTAVKSGGRVVKNVAGYDLHKLLVGSFGTLAVIVEATFKLRPLAEESSTLTFSLPEIGRLLALAARVADSVLGPQWVELVLGPDRPPLLAVGFGGLAEEVRDATARAARAASELGVPEAAEPIDEPLLRRAGDEVAARSAKTAIIRAGTRRSDFAAWLRGALDDFGKCAARVSAVVHAGIGVARFRLDDAEPKPLAAILAGLRSKAIAGGGYLVVEHAPPLWKSELDVWGPAPASLALLRGIKTAFDPGRVLSPGRFIGGI
ncbi:MAG: FAD-binding oxidoreductase, partial [Candidatus Binatia bacterium]